ncbi:hypothetical protein MKX01_029368 [Papaver californicum]|nr:hypothetical protein MKX01_029368 [Papaver californicum]
MSGSQVDIFYGFYKNEITQLVNCFPEVYRSIQVIEGDGPSVGSVRLWKYKVGGQFITTKEQMIAVNSENKSITWNFLEGDVTNFYRSFQIKLVSVTPTGAGSCLVKYSAIPSAFISLLHMISVELPSQLHKHG